MEGYDALDDIQDVIDAMGVVPVYQGVLYRINPLTWFDDNQFENRFRLRKIQLFL